MVHGAAENGRSGGQKVRGILLLLIYLVILVATIWAEYESYHIPMQNGELNRLRILRFFTNDSNIFLAVSALAAIPAALRLLRGERMGRGVILFRYVATVSTALTFWTVVCFLGPMFGYAAMYYGEDFYLHAVGPALAFFALVFLEREEKLHLPAICLSTLPMIVYGGVYVYEVVLAKNWGDFYGFVRTGHWALVYCIMVLVTGLLGLIHASLHNIFVKEE